MFQAVFIFKILAPYRFKYEILILTVCFIISLANELPLFSPRIDESTDHNHSHEP